MFEVVTCSVSLSSVPSGRHRTAVRIEQAFDEFG